MTTTTSNDIVIVEDDSEVRKAMAKTLNDSGYGVLEADSGEQVFRLLERQSWSWAPHAIIVDIILPGISGFEVIRRLSQKYTSQKKRVPIIVVSRLNTQDDVAEAEIAGAGAFLVKPFRAKKLVEAINLTVENILKTEEEGQKYSIMVVR